MRQKIIMPKKKSVLDRIIGQRLAKFPSGDPAVYTSETLERVKVLAKDHSLRTIAALITEKTGVKCSKDTVARWLRKMV